MKAKTMALSIREEKKPEDVVQQWGAETAWVVREHTGEIPMAAFNTENSALEFCLRAWAEELAR